MKRFFLVFITAALVAGCARAQQSPRPAVSQVLDEVVEVTGEALVTLVPDRVVFTLGVETFAPNVTDAVRENNQRVAAVIEALRAAGATAEEIQTSNYSIHPRQEYREGRQPRIVGYQVNNSITVRKQDPAAASRLLEAAINAGANTTSGLAVVVSDPAAGQEEGLRRAFENARAKASVLAAAAGRELGTALTIAEGSSPVQPIRRVYADMRMEAQQSMSVGEVPIAEGTEERRFAVRVVFGLR